MKPYETLGVSSSATQDEIKNAYRNLAKKFHPDLNPGNKDSERKFKEIASAYELIGNAESRAKFDRGEFADAQSQSEGRSARPGRGPFYHETQSNGGKYSQAFGGMDEDLLRSIFGRMGGKGGQGFEYSPESPGQDVLYRMDVDFKDAVLGAEREITLPSGKRLRVKIPGGFDSGAKLRFQGFGQPGTGKAPAGDAYVELNVKPSALFRRLGSDLELELPISFGEAMLGAEVKAPTIDGAVLLKIPPGVGAGARLRVAGKGVSVGGKRGDQYVVIKIVVPPEIDADLKAAVESWSKRQAYDPRAGWAGAIGGWRMSVMQRKYFSLTEVTEITGIDGSIIVSFIRREWITPASENEIDHEDLARIRLIYELRDDFGANDEAIPLILHLMDQLYHLRHQVKKHAGDTAK